mgnify:CR=1 FL=1
MLIYPAIDLKDGRCVRLEQGRFDAVTGYDDDPVARARAFEADGARWIHVVDLDGAKAGAPVQHALVGEIARAVGARVQTGGGVREKAHVAALLEAGAAAVVVGSAAVSRPDEVRDWIATFGADRVTLAMDVKPAGEDFEVAVHGWQAGSGVSLWAALDAFPVGTAERLLVTDVSRDGMLVGPNLDLLAAIRRRRPDLRLQASGGVRGLEDLAAARALGCDGAIVGKALYEGLIDLKAAVDAG